MRTEKGGGVPYWYRGISAPVPDTVKLVKWEVEETKRLDLCMRIWKTRGVGIDTGGIETDTSTRMPRPTSGFSTVNIWDPLSLLIHTFLRCRDRCCTMSVGALSRTVTRQEWSRCVKWTATGKNSFFSSCVKGG